MKNFVIKGLIFCLLFFVTACVSIYDSTIKVSVENNIRATGTYYIINSKNIPEELFSNIESIIDSNLNVYGFTKLKDEPSKQTANYLISIDIKDESSKLSNLQISILDNTSSNLKNAFVGNIIFKKFNYYGNKNILNCGINYIFKASVIEETKSFSDIKNYNKKIDCKKY